MFRLFPAVAACALLASASAQTIYKCQVDGKPAYGDRPCATGASVEIAVPAHVADADTVARLARQNALAAQIDRREAVRERREERERQRAGRVAAVQRQKCDRLRLRQKWAQEDLRRASDKALATARLRLRRQTESMAVECPA